MNFPLIPSWVSWNAMKRYLISSCTSYVCLWPQMDVLFTMRLVAMVTWPSSGHEWNYIKTHLGLQFIFRDNANKKVTNLIYPFIIIYLYES